MIVREHQRKDSDFAASPRFLVSDERPALRWSEEWSMHFKAASDSAEMLRDRSRWHWRQMTSMTGCFIGVLLFLNGWIFPGADHPLLSSFSCQPHIDFDLLHTVSLMLSVSLCPSFSRSLASPPPPPPLLSLCLYLSFSLSRSLSLFLSITRSPLSLCLSVPLSLGRSLPPVSLCPCFFRSLASFHALSLSLSLSMSLSLSLFPSFSRSLARPSLSPPLSLAHSLPCTLSLFLSLHWSLVISERLDLSWGRPFTVVFFLLSATH